MQVSPDDPRWMNVPPEVECYDTVVFRQVGIPWGILQLAKRRCQNVPADMSRAGVLAPGGADLSFLDEAIEDPDLRPYTWDIPDDCY